MLEAKSTGEKDIYVSLLRWEGKSRDFVVLDVLKVKSLIFVKNERIKETWRS